MNSILRSVIFVSILIAISSFPWQYFGKSSVVPAKMTFPFAKYIFQKYIQRKGEFSKLHHINEVFPLSDDLKILSYLPFQGGPKYQTIYILLGISVLFCIFFIGIPSKSLNATGFIISIAMTIAFALQMHDVYSISLTNLQIPVYLNLAASTLGLVSCIF